MCAWNNWKINICWIKTFDSPYCYSYYIFNVLHHSKEEIQVLLCDYPFTTPIFQAHDDEYEKKNV